MIFFGFKIAKEMNCNSEFIPHCLLERGGNPAAGAAGIFNL